ncbi:GNAT family N-acetyltransferase [Actinomycetota bacterium Odt1-20B]
MLAMGGDQVDQAVAHAVAALRTVTDQDWSVNAGGLEWSCLYTAEHIAGDFIGYATNVTGRTAAHGDYVPFDIILEKGTDPEGAVRVVEATGGLLAAVVRTAPATARGWHPYPNGSADATGFAAMGIAELLLHTHDIMTALGDGYEPPSDLCEALLAWIFPHVTPATDASAHWPTLLWATGRGTLPGRSRLPQWKWHNAIHLPSPAGRVALKEVTPAAAADLAAGGTGFLEWLGGAPFEGTRRAAGQVTKAYAEGTHRPEWGMFAIVRAEDGVAVGGMGFHGRPDEDGRAEVGYDLVEGARGAGYATEALRVLVSWAFEQPEKAAVLHAVVDQDNGASQGLAERAGFVRVADRGELRVYEARP